MSDEEIIEFYRLKEIGRENDKELIEFLRGAQEVPPKKNG